jgi:hypothetical protein
MREEIGRVSVADKTYVKLHLPLLPDIEIIPVGLPDVTIGQNDHPLGCLGFWQVRQMRIHTGDIGPTGVLKVLPVKGYSRFHLVNHGAEDKEFNLSLSMRFTQGGRKAGQDPPHRATYIQINIGRIARSKLTPMVLALHVKEKGAKTKGYLQTRGSTVVQLGQGGARFLNGFVSFP